MTHFQSFRRQFGWILIGMQRSRTTIHLKVPMVQATLAYADPSQNNLGYAVQKGSESLHLGITKTRNGRVWELAPVGNHSTATDFAKFLG